MSFGWSAGDVFEAGKCLCTIIKALDDSTGSSKYYADLMLELDVLQRTLNQVESIFKTHSNSAVPSQFPQATINALEHTVSRCKLILEGFLHTIRHYQGRLSGKGWRQSWRKIGWGLLVGEDVDKVRTTLGAHTQCLILLVESSSLQATQQARKEQKAMTQQISTELVTRHNDSQNLCREIYRGVQYIEDNIRITSLYAGFPKCSLPSFWRDHTSFDSFDEDASQARLELFGIDEINETVRELGLDPSEERILRELGYLRLSALAMLLILRGEFSSLKTRFRELAHPDTPCRFLHSSIIGMDCIAGDSKLILKDFMSTLRYESAVPVAQRKLLPKMTAVNVVYVRLSGQADSLYNALEGLDRHALTCTRHPPRALEIALDAQRSRKLRNIL